MIGMSTILSIKQRLAAGYSVAQIAREEGISEPTVRKYRDREDFSPETPIHKPRASKLDPYKHVIDSWLAEDRKRRVKQRHTATRVFDRLVAECGYQGGYTTVQKYVKSRKDELKRSRDEFLHLEWAPAEAQVDFGTCRLKVFGVEREAHYLVVTFPFSNVSLAQCFWGENSECVCEGLKSVFEFCGGVPQRLVFDNAAGIGRRIGDKTRITETFERFAAHYGFGFSFCNPYSGNEKGAVENAVGAIRRNLLVPMPRITDLRAYNRRLLESCMGRAEKNHYAKGVSERQLFEKDRAAMFGLPPKPMRIVKVQSAKTNKYGDVVLDGRHRYPLGPELGETRVEMELSAFDVAFFRSNGVEIVRYERAYGDEPTRADNPSSQLDLLFRKPGAWGNSEIRFSMPEHLVATIDAMDKRSRKEALRILRNVSASCGYDAAVCAMNTLTHGQNIPSEADVALAATCAAKGQGAVIYDDAPDLGAYDAAFGKGA